MKTREAIDIQDLHDVHDLKAVEELQMQVWGTEPAWTVPSHILHIAGDSGGILLGAFVGDVLAGFVLGFLGRADGCLYHASHMLGIHPDFQGHGIGAALKLRQRERALEQGLTLMTWTFDPLASRNAYFNMHKLGTIARTYREDLYGDMADSLNSGLPSDRLYVEWHLTRDPAAAHAGEMSIQPVRILENDSGSPSLRLDGVPDQAPLSIAVPHDLQGMKQQDVESALRWRKAVRRAFTWAFDRGYSATDFRDGAYILSLPATP